MMKSFALAAFVLASAAQSVASQQLPAIRQLGPVVAVSADSFGPQITVRHLKDGLLLNDVRNRRVLMLDSSLAQVSVVADTTDATANAYSGRIAGLIPYKGDSTLFVDPTSLSMLVIDPTGKVGRVMSVPRSQDAMMLGSILGGAAFDGRRLIYRSSPRFEMRGRPGGGASGVFTPPEMPDSSAIVGVDLATRQLDTIAFVKIPKIKMDVQRDENGRVTMNSQMNPLPVIDEWAVLSDGSIALVRGRDYHIDWVRPDGSRSSAPKIPFEWQRLTDEDKIAFIDSVKAVRERMAADAPMPSTSIAVGGPGGTAGNGGRAAGGAPGAHGFVGERVTIMGGAEGAPMRAGATAAVAAGGMHMNFVPPDELPDYKPPFFAGAVRADTDGNLWILTIPTRATAGGPVYDVVNSKGELVERVQIPPGRQIAGFGTGGVVYLLARDGAKSTLEKAHAR